MHARQELGADEPDDPTSSTELVLDAPPPMPAAESGSNLAMAAVPVLGGLGSVVLLVSLNGSGAPSGASAALRTGAVGLVLLATVAMVLVQVDRQRQQRRTALEQARRDYLGRLAGSRVRLREAQHAHRRDLVRRHPPPGVAAGVSGATTGVASSAVRWGCGTLLASPRPVAPPVAEDADPVCVAALRRLVTSHLTQRDLPALVDLSVVGHLEVCGPVEAARAHARALVCAAAETQDSSQLTVAVLCDDPTAWDWVKWLPHTRPTGADHTAPVLLARSAEDLGPPLVRRPARHALLVVDGPPAPAAAPATTVVQLLPGPGGTPGARRTDVTEHGPARVRPDHLTEAEAEAFARGVAGRASLAGPRRGEDGSTAVRAELGLDAGAHLDPEALRARRRGTDRLRVPFGVDDRGRPVHLDLKEAAEGGAGPHGLVVGATGSGKSELVRTLVLGLAVTHSPDELNLVLADFKGGATFAGMADLPHVAALITNLSDELALLDRMHDALGGELVRRQERLRADGYASARDHERARLSGAALDPLPSLVVVVDEFSEMLTARPELLELFVAIGRLGRSLGLHLLLASQRLEEGRLRGLDAHLSYRIGLRTFSAQESRSVLGVTDAAALPTVPGAGFLRTDPTSLVRFEATYVSGPASTGISADAPSRGSPAGATVRSFRALPLGPPARASRPAATAAAPAPPSELEVAVGAVVATADPRRRARQVWLPPLQAPATLAAVLGDLRSDEQHGLHASSWCDPHRLRLPIGWVDRPRQQRRDPLVLDLDGAGGHLAVVGGPRSGKSTVLQTVVMALALISTPQRCQVFVLDLAGGALADLDALPHLCARAERSAPERVTRVVAEVLAVVEAREAGRTDVARSDGSGSPTGRGDGYGEVFLVVDGWAGLREDYPGLEDALQQVAARGLGSGVHLLLSAARWSEVRPGVRDQVGSRVELRLGDPMDSEIDRRAAARVPVDQPGRAIVPGPEHVLVALPRLDLSEDVGTLAHRAATSWTGPPAPRLRPLPLEVTVDDVRRRGEPAGSTGPRRRLLIGLDERRLAPAWLDPDDEPHLLVLGDARSGRTTTLRTLVGEVVRTRGAGEAQLLVVDPRRSLIGEVPAPHLLGHPATAQETASVVADLVTHLSSRLPGPEVSAAQLRAGRWWSGAEVFVVVDDHDLLGDPHGTAMAALVPLLARARDIGLHLWLARRTGGMARAWHDPVLATLRDLAQPVLLLSGNPEEGPLVAGVRAVPAPPGRARLVSRDAPPRVLQIASRPPAH